ncbi:hypothetical protein NN561_016246 [Cricetulus griseus]
MVATSAAHAHTLKTRVVFIASRPEVVEDVSSSDAVSGRSPRPSGRPPATEDGDRCRCREGGGAAMPRYYEDKVEGGACAGVKEDLGACLLQSACVLQVARPGKALRGLPGPSGRGWRSQH